jgi:hypothetical protein
MVDLFTRDRTRALNRWAIFRSAEMFALMSILAMCPALRSHLIDAWPFRDHDGEFVGCPAAGYVALSGRIDLSSRARWMLSPA